LCKVVHPQPAAACVSVQVVLTDHIVLRGQYSKVTVAVTGYPEHDGAEARAHNASTRPTDTSGAPLPPPTPSLTLPDLALPRLAQQCHQSSAMPLLFPAVVPNTPAMAAAAAAAAIGAGDGPPNPQFSSNGGVVGLIGAAAPWLAPQHHASVQLPLATLPPAFRRVLRMAVDYYKHVGTN
jgi:hypothetical protein